MISTQAERDARLQHERFEAETRVGLDNIYSAYSNIRPCIASDKAVVEFVATFIGAEVVPTLALFREALAENPDAFRTFVVARTRTSVALILTSVDYLPRLSRRRPRSANRLPCKAP